MDRQASTVARSWPGWADRWSLLTVLLGTGLAAVHLVHSLEMRYYGTVGVVLEGGLPLVLAAGLAATGPLFYRLGYDRRERRRIVGWMVTVGALVGLLFGWTLSHQVVVGDPFHHAPFVMTTNLTAGALLGILIGRSDVTTRRHRAAVEAERETVTHQQTRLSVLGRALRHNLRNEATVILGVTDEIAERADGEIADRAALARERTAGLVRLSEKARQIDGAIAAAGTGGDTVAVADLLADVADRYDGRGTVRVDVAPGTGRITTTATILRQVLAELVENAVEHNAAEDPHVAVTARPTGDDRVEIAVADDGPGLPAHAVGVLRAERETDLEHLSGLGLWLVSWGVEALGGEVRFGESDLGGAAIHLLVPRSGP